MVENHSNSQAELCLALPSIPTSMKSKSELSLDAKDQETKKEKNHSTGIYILNSYPSSKKPSPSLCSKSSQKASLQQPSHRVKFNDFETQYRYEPNSKDSVQKVEFLHFLSNDSNPTNKDNKDERRNSVLSDSSSTFSISDISSLDSSQRACKSVQISSTQLNFSVPDMKTSNDFISMCHIPFYENSSSKNCLSFAKAVRFPSDESQFSENSDNQSIRI